MKRRKLHKRTNSKKKIWYQKGFSTLLALVGVVILGSIMLVGGIFPNEKGAIPTDRTEVIVDVSSSSAQRQQESLQLHTLKFKQCASTGAVSMQLDITGSMKNAVS